MSRRKKQIKENTTVHISFPNGIGPDEMQDIIAKAIIQADEMRVQKEEEKRIEIDKKWHEVIGYKDYSNRGWLVRHFFRFINDFFILLKIPLIPKGKIKTDWVSWSLLKVAMVILFQFITYGFLLVGLLVSLLATIQQKNITYILLAVPVYMLHGVLRMATIEIDKIEDRNYLIGLFTAIVTVISVIVAIVRG